jgi:anti-sigma regulatory factor (Ser/Thr protein kinase)
MTAAQSLGLGEDRCSDIGIVATEAATNILLHAQSGEFLVCSSREEETAWLDLLALDRGRGIRDMSRALEDGFSTIGTAGQGLGAIQRLSDATSLYSAPERGMAVWSRFSRGPLTQGMSVGAVNLPMKGESVPGDGYLIFPGKTRSLYMVADGLGHGPGAKEAADEAVLVTRQYIEESPGEILMRVHDALKKTRGAAVSIAAVHHERLIVTYSGIGNISGSLGNGTTTRSMVSQNGTLGAAVPRIHEYTYPFEPGTILLMFSDGLNSKCSLNGYPGLQSRHPELIAGLLYRDFSRRRDDATVMAARLDGDRR